MMTDKKSPIERIRDAFEAWWDEYEDKNFKTGRDND